MGEEKHQGERRGHVLGVGFGEQGSEEFDGEIGEISDFLDGKSLGEELSCNFFAAFFASKFHEDFLAGVFEFEEVLELFWVEVLEL